MCILLEFLACFGLLPAEENLHFQEILHYCAKGQSFQGPERYMTLFLLTLTLLDDYLNFVYYLLELFPSVIFMHVIL